MKWPHIIAIIVFVIALFMSGGDYAQGVSSGAIAGYWIALILGGISTFIYIVILVITTLVGAVAGGVGGAAAGGTIGAATESDTAAVGGAVTGGLLGVAGGAFSMFFLVGLKVVVAIAAIVMAVFGYHYLAEWGGTGLEDQDLLIKACVLLIGGILISWFTKGSKSSSSTTTTKVVHEYRGGPAGHRRPR